MADDGARPSPGAAYADLYYCEQGTGSSSVYKNTRAFGSLRRRKSKGTQCPCAHISPEPTRQYIYTQPVVPGGAPPSTPSTPSPLALSSLLDRRHTLSTSPAAHTRTHRRTRRFAHMHTCRPAYINSPRQTSERSLPRILAPSESVSELTRGRFNGKMCAHTHTHTYTLCPLSALCLSVGVCVSMFLCICVCVSASGRACACVCVSVSSEETLARVQTHRTHASSSSSW